MTTRYRIVTLDKDRYGVEECYTQIVRWTGKRHDKWKRCYEMKQIYGGFCNFPVFLNTEKEAEQWIKDKIDAEAKAENAELRKQAFIDANPPREVPPYRWLP